MSPATKRILARLAERGTVEDIAKDCFCAVSTVRQVLYACKARKLAYICDWLPNPNGGNACQVWLAGSGESVNPPTRRQADTVHKSDWTTSNSGCLVLHHLECKGPATKRQIAVDTGLSEVTVHNVLTDLRLAKVAHIGRWISSEGFGGSHTAVFELGPEKDARRRKGMSKGELWIRWATRKRAEFGHEMAEKMIRSRNNGGADRIVSCGRVIYERGEPRKAKGGA